MKLSENTFELLSNFTRINPSLLFKKGSVISTIAPQKQVVAFAAIEEIFEKEFAVDDLGSFLTVYGKIFSSDADIDLQEHFALFTGLNGRSKVKYAYTDPVNVVSPPDKKLKVPNPDIKFTLTEADLNWILKSADVLQSTHIVVESDGERVSIKTVDLQNEYSNSQSLEVAEGNGSQYKMIFKRDNFVLLPGNYEVTISSKGLGYFDNPRVQYFIVTEEGTTYTAA